jgi:lipid-binding SYLF domain-containing protein
MQHIVVTAALVLATATAARGDIRADEAERLASAARAVQEIRGEIPPDVWTSARCVVVIPELKKAALVIGGEFGKGVMSCRAGDRWSAPVFMQLAKGSWGFQAGVEQVDLVVLVMNDRGVQKLLANKITLGADASVAAGPVGRRGAVGTDAAMTAEIVSYSKSKGAFAGIDISGGVLRPDEDANAGVYGKGATPQAILASREISAPPPAAPFLNALTTAPSSSSAPAPTDRGARVEANPTQAKSVPATPRTTTMSTTDDDLRARVVDIQQTLDRMLADTTPAPVGTTGTVGATPASGMVTVERARLLHLREQLEALVATLNRR